MKQEIPPHKQISTRTMLQRKHDEQTYSGVAYKHIPLHPALFCSYQDDGPNWFCPRCERRIAKSLTEGDKPVSVCNNPPEEAQDINIAGIYPVRAGLSQPGEVIQRSHRTEPIVGVGHTLLRMFRLLKISIPVSCNCRSRLMYLSTMPVDEVQKMETNVLAWFEEEATNRALFFDETKAKKLLQIAYRRAKKALAKKRARRHMPDSNG